MKKEQAKINKEKLKLQSIKLKQKAAKQQARSERKQTKKKLKLRKKRQKKLNAKVDNLITVIAVLIFGSFAVVETLQNKRREKEAELNESESRSAVDESEQDITDEKETEETKVNGKQKHFRI